MSLKSVTDIENLCQNIFEVGSRFDEIGRKRMELLVDSLREDFVGVVKGVHGLKLIFDERLESLALFFHKEYVKNSWTISIRFVYPTSSSGLEDTSSIYSPPISKESHPLVQILRRVDGADRRSMDALVTQVQSAIAFFKDNEIDSKDRSLRFEVETFVGSQIGILEEEVQKLRWSQQSLERKLTGVDELFNFIRNLKIMILKSQNLVTDDLGVLLSDVEREVRLLSSAFNFCIAVRKSRDAYLTKKVDQLVLTPSPRKSLQSSFHSFFSKSVHVRLFIEMVTSSDDAEMLGCLDRAMGILGEMPQLEEAAKVLCLKITKQRESNEEVLRNFEYGSVDESLRSMERFVSVYLSACEESSERKRSSGEVAEIRLRFVTKTRTFLKTNFFDKLSFLSNLMERGDSIDPRDLRANLELVDRFYKTFVVFESMREVAVRLDEDFYSLKLLFLLTREQVSSLRNVFRYNQFLGNVRKFTDFYQRLGEEIDKKYLKNMIEVISSFERNLRSLRVSNSLELVPLLDADLRQIQDRVEFMSAAESEVKGMMLGLIQESSDLTSTVKSLMAIKSRIESVDRYQVDDLSSFKVFLNVQLLKVTVVSFKELIQSNGVLFSDQSELKVQVKINEGWTRLEVIPESGRLKEACYNRLHEAVQMIYFINDKLSAELVRKYVDQNLGKELQRLSVVIEALPLRLAEFLEGKFGRQMSRLNEIRLRGMDREFLGSIGDIVRDTTSVIEELTLLTRLERSLNEHPVNFDFEKSVKVSIQMYLQETNKMLTSTKMSLSGFLRRCFEVGVEQMSEYMESVRRLKLQRINSLDDFNVFNQEMMKVTQNKKLFEEFAEGLERFSGLVMYLQSEALGVIVREFLTRWRDFVGVQVGESIQVEAIKKDLEVELERKYLRFKDEIKGQVIDVKVIRSLFTQVIGQGTSFKELLEGLDDIYRIHGLWLESRNQCQNLEESFKSLGRSSDELLILGYEIQEKGECFSSRDFESVQMIRGLVEGMLRESDCSWVQHSASVYKRTLVYLTSKKQEVGSSSREEYLSVLERLLGFLQQQVKMMQGDSFDTSNWIEFFGIIFTSFVDIQSITLRDLLLHDTCILANGPRIKEYNQSIAENHNIRDLVVSIETWVLKQSLVTVDAQQYFNEFVVVVNLDELQEQVVDMQFQLQAVWTSKFRGKFKKELETSLSTYNRLGGLLSDYRLVQERLIDVIPFVQHNRNPREVSQSQYEQVLRTLKPIVAHLKVNKSLVDFMQLPRIQSACQEMIENLDLLKQKLQGYIQGVRDAFPRLHLLNENDLLQFIGNCSDDHVFNVHIQKVFQGVKECRAEGGSITSVVSNKINLEQEVVSLEIPVRVNECTLEEILTSLKDSLTRTLMFFLRNNVDSITSISFETITRLIGLPFQVFLLLLQIQFSKEFVASIKAMQTDVLRSKMLGVVQEITSLINKGNLAELSERYRHTCLFLISFISSMDEVCDGNSNRSWIIFKTVMFKCTSIDGGKSTKSLGRTVEVTMNLAGHKMSYSWEYQGLKAPLVYTHVTEKMFVSFSRSLFEIKGTNLVGPAGTGKTETVKFFGGLLGKFILVFNCDKNIGTNTVSNIFRSFVSEDSFLCLDEFNRFNQEQLSLVSQTIQNIQSLIRCNFKGTPFVLRNVEGFKELNSECAIFTTMNPKSAAYSSRYTLPQNLKNLFRTINISNPREVQVFQVILLSEGCVEYIRLSELLHAFLVYCKSNFSKQVYYDWSLRKIKSIFLSYRLCKATLPEQIESVRLFRSLETNLVSYLTEEDLVWFKRGAEEIFGETSTLGRKSQPRTCFDHLPLIGPLSPFLMSKFSELVDLISIRSGVILVGDSMSGKSFLWKYYFSHLSHMGQTFRVKVFNPCTVKVSRIIGQFNKNTGEFSDGYLTETLREFIEDISSRNRRDFYFVVFDSEINSTWIEAFNSVLDDNRMLSLSNGERILLPSNVKFIVECRGLAHASPATISRLGLVNMNQSEPCMVQLFIERLPSGNRLALYVDHIGSFMDQVVGKVKKGGERVLGKVDGLKSALVDARVLPQFKEFQKHFRKNDQVHLYIGMDLRVNKEGTAIKLDVVSEAIRATLESLDDKSEQIIKENVTSPNRLVDLFYVVLLRSLDEKVGKGSMSDMIEKAKQSVTDSPVSRDQTFKSLSTHTLLLSSHSYLTDEYLKSQTSGVGGVVLQLEVTKDTKTKDLLLLLTQHYKLVKKNKNSFFESINERLTVVVRNVQALKTDDFGCSQLTETLHGLLEHDVINSEGRNTYFQTTPLLLLEFIGDVHSLLRQIPSKVLLKLSLVNIRSSDRVDELISSKMRQRDGLGFLWRFLAVDSVNLFIKESQRCRSLIDFGTLLSVTPLRDSLVDDPPSTQVSSSLEYWMLRVFLEQKGCIRLSNIHQIFEHLLLTPHVYFHFNAERTKVVACRLQQYLDHVNALVLSNVSDLRLQSVHLSVSQVTLLHLLSFFDMVSTLTNQPRNIILHKGVGCGRSIILRIFAAVNDIELEVYQQSKTRENKFEFRMFLRCVLQRIFSERRRVMLVVEEEEIGDSKVVSEILTLFTCGLFESFSLEDMQMLAHDLKVEERSASREEFISFIKQHLQVCLVLKGGEYGLSRLLGRYPGISKFFTVFDCQRIVQRDFLERIMEEELKKVTEGQASATLGKITSNFSSLIKGGLFDDIPHPFVVNLIRSIKSIVREKQTSFESEVKYLSKGIQKIVDSENQIEKLRESIEQKQHEILMKEADTKEAMLRINRIYEVEKDRFKNLQSEERNLVTAEREMIGQQEMIQGKMAQITPILESAKSQIKSINKSHLDELRSLKVPPQHVVNVFLALMKLKGHLKATFEDAKKVFSSLYEFDQLSVLDFRTISEETLKKVREFVGQEASSFEPKTIYRVSQAAGPIADFIVAMLKCRELYSSIEPMERRLSELESELMRARERIRTMNKDVEKVERDLQELKGDYIAKNSDLELCKKELNQFKVNVEISKKILVSLPEEKERWRVKCDSLNETLACIVPLSYLSSLFLSFPQNETLIKGAARELGVDRFDPVTFLRTQGLEGRMSQQRIENSIPNLVRLFQATYFHYSPLIVDPSRKFGQVLLKSVKSLVTISLGDSNAFFKLCTALKTGSTIVVEDFNSDCPPFLARLIKRKYSLVSSTSREVTLCGKKLQVSSDARLILLSSYLPKDRLINKLYNYVQIIDNTFGVEWLTDHYLNIILNKVDPDLLNRKTECFTKKVALGKKLLSIENELLQSLNSIESSIVEDETFINYLENIKQSNLQVTEQIRKEEVFREQIRVSEEKYKGLASESASLFLKLSAMTVLSPFFTLSLEQFNYVVNIAVGNFQERSTDQSHFRSILLECVINRLGCSLDSSSLSLFLYTCLVDDPVLKLSQDQVDLLEGYFSRVCHFKVKSRTRSSRRKSTLKFSVNGLTIQSDMFTLKNGENDLQSMGNRVNQLLRFIGVNDPLMGELLADLGHNICSLLSSNSKNWKIWFQTPDCENHFPSKSDDTELQFSEKMLVIVIFRGDRFLEFVKSVYSNVMKMNLASGLNVGPLSLMWKDLSVPLVISTNQFSDPSESIRLLSKSAYPSQAITDISCNTHNLQTIQGILKSEYQGVIVLRNLHLVPAFYNELVKLIDFGRKSEGRNVIITTDECDRLPMALINESLKVVMKSQSTFDSNFANTISLLDDSVLKTINGGLRSILVQMIQFHSIVCELDQSRRHFSKLLEFGFSEFECVMEFFKQNKTIDTILFLNLLVNLIETSFHGSKCDNPDDLAKLIELVRQVFNSQSILKDLDKKPSFGLFDLQSLHSVMKKSNFRAQVIVPESESQSSALMPSEEFAKLMCSIINS